MAAATSTSSDAANSSDPANSSDSAPCDTSESTGSSDAATGLTESADTADIADTKLPTSGLPDTTDSHPLDAADSLSSPPSDTADTTIDATPQDDTTVADTHDMVAGVTDMANATDTHDTAETDATGTHDTAETDATDTHDTAETDATDTPAVDMAEAPACEAPEESRSRTEPKTGLELRSVPPSAVVCPSILPSSNRAAIMTSISKPHPLSKEREGVAPSELHLLDSHQVLMEEKEVGPDISYVEDLSAMEKETEPLPKPSGE